MIAVVSCLAGVLGMLALWWWAWRLWPRADVSRPAEQRPGRRRPTLPPSWLFADSHDAHEHVDHEHDAAPIARVHASSNTDTDLFPRERSTAAFEEPTEVLSEEQMLDPGETQPSIGGKTRTLGLFVGPQPGTRQ